MVVKQRLTQAQAAELLGCHVSNIPKLIRRGLLHSERLRDGSLDRVEVEALAKRRAAEKAALVTREPRRYQRVDHRPDQEHEWLSPSQVAQMLGVTRPAVQGRINRGKVPAVQNGGRWWVRRDLLEQVEAARLVRKTRRP